jgi:hypothetical protein
MSEHHSHWLCDAGIQSSRVLPPRELALHEAAHAIVVVDLARRPIWVEIDPERSWGQMVPETPWHSGTPRAGTENLIIAMAGSAAQLKLLGRTPYCWTHRGRNDRQLAHDLAVEFGLDAADFSRVSKILDRSEVWKKINALAELLVERLHIHTCETDYF